MIPLYETEIEKISNIKYENLSDEQLKNFLHGICGIALLNLQKTEFIIQGIISHFNQKLLEKDKRFKNLTPQFFLDNDKVSKKKRKQTLGTLLEFLTKSTNLFNFDELEIYTENRNTFIHSFWRDFLSKEKINDKEELYKSLSFIIELIKLDIKWQYIFQGFLFEFAKKTAEKTDTDFSGFTHLKKYQNDFIDYIQKKSS